MVSNNPGVKPIIRGIQILELLSKQNPLTLEEVCGNTGIPASSAFRYLTTLESVGYVERTSVGGTYRWTLGISLLSLVHAKFSRLDIRAEMRVIMEELADRTDEFVQLGVLDRGKVLFIEMVKRPKPLAIIANVGSRLAINVCAAGLVLAAYLQEEELDRLLRKQPLPKNTPKARTDPTQLKTLLKAVVKQGFSIDDEYYALGHRCIGAPIFDHKGRVIAAINISGSASHINEKTIPILAKHVMECAVKGSKRMGYVAS